RAQDAPVLVAERDLQVEDVLPVALKAEVAGLDDARVDGPDGDLVYLLALDAIKVHHTDDRGPGSPPTVLAFPPGGGEADGLEPGVTFWHEGPILGDLRLEQVSLGAVGGEGWIGVAGDDRGPEPEDALAVRREHRPQRDPTALAAAAEERREPLA